MGVITPDFIPDSTESLLAALSSWEWRIFSGQLYKVLAKEDSANAFRLIPTGVDPSTPDGGFVVPFVPNAAQREFVLALHYRNVILKARQLGFTTLIAILWLDHALFNADQRCVIIADKKVNAEIIFRDKVRFAYDKLPDAVRMRAPLKRDSAEELLFAHNNSSVRVTVSARSATAHRLHVSELGKIAATAPAKAKEIVSGGFAAVPTTGVIIVESTAEGQSGKFYELSNRAQNRSASPRPLNPAEFRFHFFPWYLDPGYTLDPDTVLVSDKDHEYFDGVEAEMGVKLDPGQRAWYVAQREDTYSGDLELTWREMPSTPAEAWRRSTEGVYYNSQLTRAYVEGRLTTELPIVSNVPVNSFWDIGSKDGTAIWLHQRVGPQDRFIGFNEWWGQPFSEMTKWLQAQDVVWGVHYLPHDAVSERQTKSRISSPIADLTELAPNWRWHIVPQVHDFMAGIRVTREAFSRAWICPVKCKAGIDHLQNYRKRWNSTIGWWADEPVKNEHTEAADAFRQWAQGFSPTHLPAQNTNRTPPPPRAGAMAI